MAEMTKNWVTRMINRHAETVLEIDKVKKHLANAGNNPKISKVTYGNLSLLLRDLKNLERTYRIMLENENASLSGMISATQGKIFFDGEGKENRTNELFIKAILSIKTDKSFLGIPYSSQSALTTYDEISTILDDIKNNKVKQTYQKKHIVYDIKKNKDSYVILKKDLTNILKLKEEMVKQQKELLKQQESMKLEEKTKRELYEIKIRKDTINRVEKKLEEKRLEAKKILMKDDIKREDLEKVKRIIIYSKKKSMLIISEMNNEIYREESIKILLNELIVGMSSLNIEGLVVVKNKMNIKGRIMSYLYDIVYELIENSKNNAVMIYVFSDNNMVNLKAVIGTNKKIKDKLKLDSNIKVKEKVYDTDTELIFTIKDSDKL